MTASKGRDALELLFARIAASGSDITSAEQLFEMIPEVPASEDRPADAPALRPAPIERLPVAEATVRAAIGDTYLVEELPLGEARLVVDPGAADGEGAGDDEALRALLELSDSIVIGGQARLRLRPSPRADLLRRVWEDAQFRDLLRSEYRKDVADFDAIAGDPIRVTTAWLRSFLLGRPGDTRTAPLAEVQAAVAALEDLQEARDLLPPIVPELEDARQDLLFAELLEPLRILIGSQGWDGVSAQDRFVGRAADLRTLRSFVGELASQSFGETVSRSIFASAHWALGQLGGARPRFMMVEAQGGLGKSSLIAKFVLDHVYGQQSDHFLFAYLDFDRAGIQARDPALLLLEVVRQVALQARDAGFQELHETLRESLAGAVHQQRSPFEQFRRLLRAWSETSGSPFLLVLDTLEVAQFDPDALAAINRFLTALTEPLSSEPSPFAQLRIVGAGRAPLEGQGFLKYVSVAKPLKLKPLGVMDARSMATALGHARIGSDWQERWSTRIAGVSTDEGDRREPLSIRIAADLLIAARPEDREPLSIDIAARGEDADESFVGRLYADRVLNHVRDQEVARLAWPGLILRHINVDIAREVLAEPCKLKPESMGRIVDKLAREVWMVEPTTIAGRSMLRHRRELRARTLPLMRRQDSKLFAEVNSRAISYFGERRADPFARAEWLYHRLLEGEEPESVDQGWTSDVSSLLADAHYDFRSGTPVRGYLLARTATAPLPRAVIETVPEWILAEHVGRACLSLAQFDEPRMSGALLHISMAPPAPILSADAESGRATLFVKAGRWEVEAPATPATRWLAAWRFAECYRAARSGESKLAYTHPVPTPDQVGIADHGWLAQLLAAKIRCRAPDSSAVDSVLADLLEHPTLRIEDLDAQSLRVAALFGEESCRPAARLWAARQYLGDRNPAEITVSGAELGILEQQAGWLGPLAGDSLATILRFSATAANGQPIRLRDPALGAAMRTAVEKISVAADPRIEPLIRSFIAQRQSDWIVPLAYATGRLLAALPNAALQPLAERVRGYSPNRSFLSRDDPEDLWLPAPRDFNRLLRLADEASDLRGMSGHVLQIARAGAESSGGGSPARDLERLAGLLDDWNDLVAAHTRRVRPSRDEKTDSPPPPPPVVDEKDAQKGRWGGAATRDGRRLTARVTAVRKSSFNFDLTVESEDGSLLRGPVVFHLHPTFTRSVIAIRRIREGRFATLYDINAYGAFTVGVQVRDGSGRWTSLELDLVEVEGLPERLHDK